MTYKALLIQACNGNGVAPSNYHRSSRNIEAAPPPPAPSEPQPALFLPRLPPGYIYYGGQQDLQATTSLTDGAITGHEQRLSPQSLSTLHVLQRNTKRGKNFDVLTSIFFDKYSPGFQWLIQGWLAEKRILPQHTYRWLYYDPLGRQYRSKQQVLRFWKEQETTQLSTK